MQSIILFSALFICLREGVWARGEANIFDQCQRRIEGILNGTETYGNIDKETIEKSGYIYHGRVAGMNPDFPRENLLTITTRGCLNMCGPDVDWYWISDITLTLGIVSNWVIPIIALLACLPYESFDGKKREKRWLRGGLLMAVRTLGQLFNWLGSPQTALTAIFFNIYQIVLCLRAARTNPHRLTKSLRMDAYYVLSCIGQFELPEDSRFLEVLLYSLFRPLCTASDGTTSDDQDRKQKAEAWTAQLLRAMALQLRSSRRRGVWPTFASILLFFVAYVVSVALAFSTDMGDRTTTHSLAFGILISWFPLLALFAILDRNPNCADRTSTLISRWMWNGRAIKAWETDSDQTALEPNWWTPTSERNLRRRLSDAQRQRETPEARVVNAQSQEENPQSQSDNTTDREKSGPNVTITLSEGDEWDCTPGSFIGQGRKIGYNGLAYAVISAIADAAGDNPEQLKAILSWPEAFIANPKDFPAVPEDSSDRPNFVQKYERRPPKSWWVLAVTALMIVLVEIGMAVTMSSTVPTVGVGCRSGLYIIYFLLSSSIWVLHLIPWFRRQGLWAKVLGHGLSFVATLCLTFITFASFSGVLKNCICRGGLSAYLDFQNAGFYSDQAHFNVTKFWWTAATIGAFPVVLCFFVAVVLIKTLQPLWQDGADAKRGGEAAVESDELEGTSSSWLN